MCRRRAAPEPLGRAREQGTAFGIGLGDGREDDLLE